MSKKVSEILNSDIQVPEIVQKKADVAFSQIQSERETNMSKKNLKVTKLFAAMAACASIIIVASTTNNYLNRPQEEKETTVAEHTTTEKENMFTMKVMAAQAEVTAQTGDIEKAGDALSSVNVDDLSADAKSIYDTINAQVNAEYMAALYKEGYDAYSGKKYDDAVSALSKVVERMKTMRMEMHCTILHRHTARTRIWKMPKSIIRKW